MLIKTPKDVEMLEKNEYLSIFYRFKKKINTVLVDPDLLFIYSMI